MNVAFKPTVPDVLVAECADPATGRFNCIVIMQSMERWSAYIDGDMVGSGFSSAAEAQSFALSHLKESRLERQRFNRTALALAALAVGAAIYWAAVYGHFAAVSEALAGAMTSNPVAMAHNAKPSASPEQVGLSVAVNSVPERPIPANRRAELEPSPGMVSPSIEAEIYADAPLIHPPHDNIALPPLPAASAAVQPEFVRLLRSGPTQAHHAKRTSRPRVLLPRSSRQEPSGSQERILERKRRAKARKLRPEFRAKANKRVRKHTTTSRRPAARRQLAKRRLAKIKRRNARRHRVQQQRAAQRRAAAARSNPASRRRLSYREFQMLRNRVIAKRIRQRHRYAH